MSDKAGYRVVLVDDDDDVIRSLEQWLRLSGFETATARSAREAAGVLDEFRPDAVLLDVRMPDQDGLEFLRALRAGGDEVPVVMLTGHGDVPMAVEALKAGAFDFLTKPADPERLVVVLRNGAEQHRLRRRVRELEAGLDTAAALEAVLVGHSPAIQRLRAMIPAIAPLPADVLIYGETGAGKEVVARAIHDTSPRRSGPFVAINCAAIPAEMIESELFGHEAGAFTGARGVRIGKFEHAGGGTLFLDEVESMPLAAQTKVLRILQERRVERLGSNRLIPVDIRVVAASKPDLRQACDRGTFRADLYFRLAGIELTLPPLRARGEDILLLFVKFATEAARLAQRTPANLSPLDASRLLGHGWPGNVRELRAVAERFGWGLGLTLGGMDIAEDAGGAGLGLSLAEHVDACERALIVEALRRSGGAIQPALEQLKIPRRTLNEKMARLGIKRGNLAP
ncbi:MAG: sigma-54-dependent Fis family transcriptional regulator [Hyphomicrobiaceae bacterium]|nr:sigma-54-dependent Fis family transcriptional regulator [Hyphomicrobiaceae bacterium]